MKLRAAALALSMAAFGAVAEPIETARGVVDAPDDAKRVAVFDLAALDTLQALGVPVAGVPSNLYLPYLDRQGAEVVGTVFEPDFEAVHALAPELIVVGGRSMMQLDPLARLSPAIDMTIGTDAVSDGLSRLHAYGKLFGKEDKARELAAGIEARMQTVKEAAKGRGRALVVLTNGPKISAYGGEGRFGWLYRLGFAEAVESVTTTNHGEAISFEYIRDADPDVLIVLDRLAAIGQPGASARDTLDNELVRETRAWKSGAVIHLSAGPIYIAPGGVQSLSQTLDELLAALKGG